MRRPTAFALALLTITAVVAGVRGYYGPGLTTVLAPSADASVTGTWTVTEGTDLYDELDEAAAADGSNLADGDTSSAYIDLFTTGRAEFDLTDDLAYGGASIRINWVGIGVTAKTSAYPVYSGDVAIGLLIGGSDYIVTDIQGTATTYQATNPLTSTRYYTNPDTGAEWTSADVDALQAYIESNATAPGANNLHVSWLGVVVNYSAIEPVSETTIYGAGD